LIGWLSINQQTNLLSGDDLVASLSEQHQQQKSALLVEFKDQPALTENWQDQLKEMDEAAEAIKLALVNEPNNMPLLKMLQTVHQQQINLIERVHSPKWSQI
jgi:sugar phosphate isomerase/epimerase